MAEAEYQPKRPVKPSDRYEVKLVEDAKSFVELAAYSKEEHERLKKAGHKFEHGEHVPGFRPLIEMKPEDYLKNLEVAKGNTEVLPEELRKDKHFMVLNAPRTFAMILRDKENGKISGYIFHDSRGYTAYQDMLYIAPESRKQGVAKILTQAAEKVAGDFGYPFLEIKAENPVIRDSLLKSGYRKEGPESGYRVIKELEPSEEEKPVEKKEPAEKKEKDEA